MRIAVALTLAGFLVALASAGSTFAGARIIETHSTIGLPSFESALQTERSQTMSNSVSTLLTRNLNDVFGENDAKRRRAAIDEIYTEDIVFYESNKNVYRGRDEIERRAAALRAQHPDFGYQVIAGPEEAGNGGRVQWLEGRPAEAPVVGGTDVIIARNGRIAAIYFFFDKMPSAK
jgi:hypothetical protein